MPPKVRITLEMIQQAAFQLVRESGIDALNARSVAAKLGCSTQPVMYHFETIEELRRTVYGMADAFHTEYLMQLDMENPVLSLGRNYIRFAVREPHLFRFLFQSGQFSGMNLNALLDAPELMPMLQLTAAAGKRTAAEAKLLFRKMFIVAHGYACLLANNQMNYDEEACLADLRSVFEPEFGGEKHEKGL